MSAGPLPELITAPRTDAVYNCHAYLTKVPIAAIRPFIEAFTAPGEVVADFFAGSGMTGLAALTLNRGARLSDISVLGRHIARGYLAVVPAKELREHARKVMDRARQSLGELYLTRRASDGEDAELVRTVWSFTYCCPSCDSGLVYFDHLDSKGKPPASCPECKHPFARRSWGRGEDVPVRVVVWGADGRQEEQHVAEIDRSRILAARKDGRLSAVPSMRIDKHREMYSRSGLGKSGMTETAKFFSPRNGIALVELWRAIEEVGNEKVRAKLRFAFTAILARASMRYQWSAKRPLNAQNQTYYVAPVYYEWNVFELFERKVEASIRAADELFSAEPLFRLSQAQDVQYAIASADSLSHLADESVDYVFTDPPFGANIFYSDMSLFHEAWLGDVTDHTSEAVVHTTGERRKGAEERYEELLRRSFSEGWRILKPGRHMSVVFGNSSGRIWGLVQRALREAGFKAAPVHVAVLDKGQRSVKGLNSGSEGVVTLDLILTVQKPAVRETADHAVALRNGDAAALIAATIAELPPESKLNPSHVYVGVLKKAIERHLVLDDLHLGDALIALRNAGYTIDRSTGLLSLERPRSEKTR